MALDSINKKLEVEIVVESRQQDKKSTVHVFILFILLTALTLLIIINNTQTGYMATIKYHGFINMGENIYVDEDFTDNMVDTLNTVYAAQKVNEKFWGSCQSTPKIIITNNDNKLSHLGYNGSPALTSTYVLNGAHTSVVICPKGLTVDILSHELCHAEMHSRLYADKAIRNISVPTWFDEGVAMQVDLRKEFNENSYFMIGDKYKNVSAENIYSSKFYEDSNNYIIARHEIRTFIENNGKQALFGIIKDVNNGKNFSDCYHKYKQN